MENLLLVFLIIIVVLTLIGIFFWVKSFKIYLQDHTQKDKAIRYKIIAIILCTVGIFVGLFGIFVKEKLDNNSQQNFANSIIDDYHEQYSPTDFIYQCPKCGEYTSRTNISHNCIE